MDPALEDLGPPRAPRKGHRDSLLSHKLVLKQLTELKEGLLRTPESSFKPATWALLDLEWSQITLRPIRAA